MAVFPRHPKALLPKGLLLKGEIASLPLVARNDRKKGKDCAMTSACCHCEPKAKQSRLFPIEEVRIPSLRLHPRIKREIASLPLVARNDRKKGKELAMTEKKERSSQ